MLISGPAIYYFSNIRKHLPADVDAWGVSLNYLMAMVVGAGIMVMVVYWWINKYVLTDPFFYNQEETKKVKGAKPKMSLGDSFKYILSSPYILCLAVLVISYGIAINLVEVTWKNQLKLQYPNANDYSAFMGQFSTLVGAVTIFMMLFVVATSSAD